MVIIHDLKKFSPGLIVLFVFILYWKTHLWNFAGAPWNQNGLFDDAAWDIYFAKNHAFVPPYQAAFFDEVGRISREVVFAYYITIFFKLFGYNLFVFNVSLLVLGFVTVLFTVMLIHKIFRRPFVTIVSAVILNFFPLHFLHIFMGHRYAIAAPLMMVSFYFFYAAFADRSRMSAVISGIFAALTLGSSVMGKQYLYGLVAAGLTATVFPQAIRYLRARLAIGIVWAASLVVAALPLLWYMAENWSLYMVREQSLVREFFRQYQQGGLGVLAMYAGYLTEVLFAPFSYRRQFLPGFPAIPIPYYLLIVPGLFLLWAKKQFAVVFLAIIPLAAAFVSGAYDFRILIGVPFWVIAMAMSMDESLNVGRVGWRAICAHLSSKFALPRTVSIRYMSVLGKLCASPRRPVIFIVVIGIIAVGLVPSVGYLWKISLYPNSVFLLPHKDVAVSRMVQDIVAGDSAPNTKMKWDEFNRYADFSRVSYDTLVCPESAFAIAHLFLQNYDDKRILSLCNGGIQRLQTSEELMRAASSVVTRYQARGKDLKLIWEVSEKSQPVIDRFDTYSRYGKTEIFTRQSDGNRFSLYSLTIDAKNTRQLQQDMAVTTGL